MSRSNSPPSNSQSRNALGQKMSTLHAVWWRELNFCTMVKTVKDHPGKSMAFWNEKFREAQPTLRAAHATDMNYQNGFYSITRMSKEFSGIALRNIGTDASWIIVSNWVLQPQIKTNINLRWRMRDEVSKGLTKGYMYQIIEDLRTKHSCDISHADYQTEEKSTKKYRSTNPCTFHDRQEMIYWRNYVVRALCEEAAKSDPHPFDASEESEESSELDNNIKRQNATVAAKVELQDACNCVAELEFKEENPESDTPIQRAQNSIHFDSACKKVCIKVPNTIIYGHDFGHRMPPYDDTAEYHQCFALACAASLCMPVSEVRAQMKMVSMAFKLDPNAGYRMLPGSKQKIADHPSMTSSFTDPEFLKLYCLPCFKGRDLVILTHVENGSDGGTFVLDSFTHLSGLISDSCVLLLLRHEHYTVMEIPARKYPTPASFVSAMEQGGIQHCNSTIREWYDTEPSMEAAAPGFTTPNRRTTPKNDHPKATAGNDTKPHLGHLEGRPTLGSPATMNSDSGSCYDAAVSLISEPEGSDTEAPPAVKEGHMSLFAASGRGPATHPLLDKAGKTTYADKTTYMAGLIAEKTAMDTGPHQEANSKVVTASDKKAQLAAKGKKAASIPNAYTAGKPPKNLNEKALVYTRMIKGSVVIIAPLY